MAVTEHTRDLEVLLGLVPENMRDNEAYTNVQRTVDVSRKAKGTEGWCTGRPPAGVPLLMRTEYMNE